MTGQTSYLTSGSTPPASLHPSAAASRFASSESEAMGSPLVPVPPSPSRRWGLWGSSRRSKNAGAISPDRTPDAQATLGRSSVIDKVKSGTWDKDADLEGQQEHTAVQVRAAVYPPLPEV